VSAKPDARFMQRALDLARARLGKVAPNPAVGCVIVKDGVIVGEGATSGVGGSFHAEEAALEAAGTGAAGADAYVTLEPCGKRSAGGRPCARRLLGAGVARVIIAMRDPHPHGASLALLEEWGLPTSVGLCEDEARALNAGFLSLVETERPLLVIGGDPDSCDAQFEVLPGETPEAALVRLGQSGMTRVWVADEASVYELIENGARAERG
jgi:diaminohydroxyphosphoribosylaminopyrimidine deaminase/5-amino-6-(5-phosphoribosylamino)uracil reductase